MLKLCLIKSGKLNRGIEKTRGISFISSQILNFSKIKLCDLYKEPFNFTRTGCRFCPFSLDLQHQLDVASELLPVDKIAGENLWKPVFDEYRRLGYRLSNQMNIFEK